MMVKSVMTNDVSCLNPSAKVAEAAKLMELHNIGSVPVCSADAVVGIVTDRDIVIRGAAYGKDLGAIPVSDVMTTNVTTVSPNTDIKDAARLMAEHQVRRLPVVENNKLVGILALGDIATNPDCNIEASEALTEISHPSRPVNM